MDQVDRQGLVSSRRVAGGHLAYHLVVGRGRQVKGCGLSHRSGDGLGFDHRLAGVIIDPANGGRDRWHWIRKGDRQVRVRIGDGHRRSSIGIGGMVVMGQDGSRDSVPMSRRPRALLDDLIGHQVGGDTAAQSGNLGLKHRRLVGNGVLVLNNPVGLGRFRVGHQAVGDVQANGLIRLGRQPVMRRLVGG